LHISHGMVIIHNEVSISLRFIYGFVIIAISNCNYCHCPVDEYEIYLININNTVVLNSNSNFNSGATFEFDTHVIRCYSVRAMHAQVFKLISVM